MSADPLFAALPERNDPAYDIDGFDAFDESFAEKIVNRLLAFTGFLAALALLVFIAAAVML